MEERRKRCEKDLQEMEEWKEEEMVAHHDACLERVSGVRSVLEKVDVRQRNEV